MDELTLKALKNSISNWELKRDDEYPGSTTMGWRGCPLCRLYHPTEIENKTGVRPLDSQACDGCPVKERTGLGWCEMTPYYKVLDIHNDYYEDKHKEWKAACQEEINFLTSLLPNQDSDGTTPA